MTSKNIQNHSNNKILIIPSREKCFCGDSIDLEDNVDINKCNCPCKVNSSVSCGCSDFTLISEILEPRSPCAVKEIVCGANAICELDEGSNPVCSCKPGVTGEPYEKCCEKMLTCSCWGDPHLTTFDGVSYDFMGSCMYDLVSTNCFNRTLVNCFFL